MMNASFIESGDQAHDTFELSLDPIVAEIAQTPALTGDYLCAQCVVESKKAQELGGTLEILRVELHPSVAECIGNSGRCICHDGHVGSHGFEEGHAESFMLAHRDIHGGVSVVNRELVIGYRTGKYEPLVQKPVLRHERSDHRIVPRHNVVSTNEDEA